MWTRKGVKAGARQAVKGSYWAAVAVCFVLAFVAGEFSESTSVIHRQSGESGNYSIVQEQVGGQEGALTPAGNAVERALGGLFNTLTSGHSWLFKALAGGLFIAGGALMLLFQLFISHPLQVGARRFFLVAGSVRAEAFELGHCFHRGRYWNTVKVMFLKYLFLQLWFLLLIVPGIVKSYEYRMVPFLLAEDPTLDYKAVFAHSRAMMRGQKWRAFVLDVSFLGWRILSAFTFGLTGILYSNPYIVAANAQLYAALRGHSEGGGWDE